MSTHLVEMKADVYGYGCYGDVVTLTDEQLAALDKKAAERGIATPYECAQNAPAAAPAALTDEQPAEEAKKKTAEEAKKKTADEAKKKTAEEAKKKTADEAKKKTADEAKKKTADEAKKEDSK